MSFDYFVAVHRDKWPTSAAVQEALNRLGAPLILAQQSDAPFSAPGSVIKAVLEGRPVELDAEVEQTDEIGDPESLFGTIAEAVSPEFVISNGDYFLTLTFRSDIDQIRAGLYLAAAIILKFDGYGFEDQFETHGGVPFAEQLLLEAAAPWDSEIDPALSTPTAGRSRSFAAWPLRWWRRRGRS